MSWTVVHSIVKKQIYLVLLVSLLLSVWLLYIVQLQHLSTPPDTIWNHQKPLLINEQWTFKFIETNGVRLSVVEAHPKQPNGQLIILLHGFPETGLLSWYQQLQPLANEGYLVVAPDMRGYNKSDKPEDPRDYRLTTLATDIVGLIDHYQKEKAFVVGHDWGAFVAWWFAHLFPQRVSKLAILNVPHPRAYQDMLLSSGGWEQLTKSWYILFFQFPSLPEYRVHRDNCTWLLRALAFSGINPNQSSFTADSIPRYLQAWNEPGAITAMLNYYRALGWYNDLSAANHFTMNPIITTPTLILWGKQDIALSAELPVKSLVYCPNGRMILYEDGSHWVQHDKPKEVTSELLGFFKETQQ